MILLPKSFREMTLVILEAANTTYNLTLMLITQKHTNIDVCKILFQPLSRGIRILLPLLSFFPTRLIQIFSF